MYNLARGSINKKDSSDKRPRPKILEACKHQQGQLDPLRLYGDVYALLIHFVDEHEDMKHDEKYQFW